MKIHSDVTIDRVVELIEEDDNTGLCLACGAERPNTEPDARRYECDECGAKQVYGAEQILLEVNLTVFRDDIKPQEGA
jgi:Zn finger protein HypA/HybF involved in hydrogenase expression